MAWIPSHDNLGTHPKLRRAARLAGVSRPAMVGHLHLLWHWALNHAPDGDLSRFDAGDLADAVEWDGDPDVFMDALVECGPGDSAGFCERNANAMRLHDWSEYGGRYRARSDAGKKAAAARWATTGNDNATSDTPSEQGGDANAMRTQWVPHSNRNAEERRREENPLGADASKPKKKPAKRATPTPDIFPITDAMVEWATGKNIYRGITAETERFLDHHRAKGSKFRDWTAAWRKWMTNAVEWHPERFSKPAVHDPHKINEVYR